MTQVLSLSLEAQNQIVSYSVFDQIKRDSKHFADENGEDLGDYLMRDYDANPEGWDSCFEHSYDEISAAAKEERRNIVERMIKAF